MRIFFLCEITEIKKQGEGAGYFIQVGTPRGGWSAEAENGKGKMRKPEMKCFGLSEIVC